MSVAICGSMVVILPSKVAARIGIDRDANGLADLELRAVLLRHGEVRIEHRQIGQRDDLRARRQVLTDFDLANAELAVERRPHQLLRDDGFGLGDAGLGLVERRLRGIDRRLRAELARRPAAWRDRARAAPPLPAP